MAKYQSSKTYGTDRGLSCCFRQWRANHSHCSTLHGYSLGFKFVFESDTLDEKNWCFDFGGMKPIKSYLDYMFDHTVLIAEDDPALPTFIELSKFSLIPEFNGKTIQEATEMQRTVSSSGLVSASSSDSIPHVQGRVCDLRIVPGVGCEMTAKLVYNKTVDILKDMKAGNIGRYIISDNVRLVSVECFEHAGNSAVYYGNQ